MCEKSPGRFSFVHAYNLFRVKTANRGALLPLFFNDRHAVTAQRISPAILAPEASPRNEYIYDMKINCSKCQQKSLTGFKLCATTPNDMQQGEQTDSTCNIQQCWELLANNLASVCTRLNRDRTSSHGVIVIPKNTFLLGSSRNTPPNSRDRSAIVLADGLVIIGNSAFAYPSLVNTHSKKYVNEQIRK